MQTTALGYSMFKQNKICQTPGMTQKNWERLYWTKANQITIVPWARWTARTKTWGSPT